MMVRFSIMLFIFSLSSACFAGLSNDRLEARWQATIADLEQLDKLQKYPFDECFELASSKHKIPKLLIIAIARGESNFDPGAVSNADAYGLMQIRWPITAQHLGIHNRLDLYDACINIDAGTRYIGELLQTYEGNVHRALAAYNYGPAKIPHSGADIPIGARWYSNYIHGQLAHVLGNENQSFEKSLVMTSSMQFRAAGQLAYLKSMIPYARFELYRSGSGRYQILLLHSSPIELRHGVDELNRIGFEMKTTL